MMDKFVSFMDKTGFNFITAVVTAFLGYHIILNLLKQVKMALLVSKLDNSLVNFVLTILKFVFFLLLIILCISTLGIPVTGLVSAISAATLAIGLAVKDLIGSVANGLMLVLNCPFKEGDYVEIDQTSGTIKEVRLLHTILTTPDNKEVMIPNHQMFTATITNYSVNATRRMDLVVSADYAEDPEKVRAILLKVARKNPLVLSDPEPACHYNYGDSSAVVFTVRVWCKNADYWTVKWDLDEQLTKTIKDSGIGIPFPQITVSYRKEEQ